MSDENLCQCRGCERQALHLGMCNKHWRRNKRYGSPFVTKNQALRGLPVDQRFRRSYREMPNGCWQWQAGLDADGYGLFSGVWNDVRYKRAHRFSWAFHSLSEIPKDMMVCHSCDNRRCVNPAHLWLGEAKDNHADMVSKNRHNRPHGDLSARAILTEKQVRAILSDSRPYGQIAADYGVKMTTVSSIKNRVSWAHVEVEHVAKNPRGSGSGHRGKSSRITAQIVREIRASAEQGTALARRFAVSPQLISNIRKGRCWAHVQ